MQTFAVHRSQTTSAQGMVAAQHLGAAQAGARVLAEGGNAMDAAVVTALVLSVVEPWLSGIGGGGFLLHADPATGQVDTLDFNVIAPGALNPADYPLVAGGGSNWFNWPTVLEDRNVSGYRSICVPGAVAGLAQALERFGTLSFAQALAPAIEQAHLGLDVDWFAGLALSIDAAGLAQYPASAELFLDARRAPRVGDRPGAVRRAMRHKAQTLERLAQAGAADFYEGELARKIVEDLQAGGSCINAADLKAYRPRWTSSLFGDYRGHQVHVLPGLSGGPTLLRALQTLSQTPLNPSTPADLAATAYAASIREAYDYRLQHMGHAATPQAGCTSHLSVVDREGRMVSLTNTLLSRFGSKVVLPQTGFLMNNGMMWFDPRASQPNSMAPGAKPLANMCPTLVVRDGAPWLAIGAAGGRTIVPAVLQLISHLVDRGMTLEQAFLTPRVEASTARVNVSDRAPEAVAASLARQFEVAVVPDTVYPVQFAVPSAVMRTQGVNTGMAHHLHPWAGVAVAAQDKAQP
jgi:gamma-glutamyltranspeptidase/glutathione hydrolase